MRKKRRKRKKKLPFYPLRCDKGGKNYQFFTIFIFKRSFKNSRGELLEGVNNFVTALPKVSEGGTPGEKKKEKEKRKKKDDRDKRSESKSEGKSIKLKERKDLLCFFTNLLDFCFLSVRQGTSHPFSKLFNLCTEKYSRSVEKREGGEMRIL